MCTTFLPRRDLKLLAYQGLGEKINTLQEEVVSSTVWCDEWLDGP